MQKEKIIIKISEEFRKRKPHPRNKYELVAALKEEWVKIDPEIVKKLFDSMSRRAVIEIQQ
nr:7432_t:CDS:2 [Entrophospora candida]